MSDPVVQPVTTPALHCGIILYFDIEVCILTHSAFTILAYFVHSVLLISFLVFKSMRVN